MYLVEVIHFEVQTKHELGTRDVQLVIDSWRVPEQIYKSVIFCFALQQNINRGLYKNKQRCLK